MHLRTDTSSNAHFARVPTISRSRNAFSVADKHVTTMQFDALYPMFWKFMYPGDTLAVTHGLLARLNTQITTLYDDLYFDMHAWFVPLRLIQTNWARFQFNAQPLGPSQDNSALTTPGIDLDTLGSGGFASKSLYDYMRYPTKIDYTGVYPGKHINNYPPRAYNLIYNENYRDENLQNAVVVDLDEGPDLASDYTLLKRGKRHDALTSALTAAQKGQPASIPLGTKAPVYGIGKANQLFAAGPSGAVYETGASTSTTYANYSNIDAGAPNSTYAIEEDPTNPGFPNIWADLSVSSAAANLQSVRQSFAIQHLLEADARGGTRDVEAIQHRWGVTVPDFRLQKPEYIGGTTFSFDGHVVPQTSESATTPQANLAQFSSTENYFNINHSFVEHGVFMILLSARSNITYQQGLPYELRHKTRYDFYQPEFANLGEVAMPNDVIMAQGTSADEATFGYQEYGWWMRYGMNAVTAEMRSNYALSLDSKHMADDYATLPTLGPAWIQSNTPISRNIVVDTTVADPIELNMLTKGVVARTIPMFSIPGLLRL